MFVGTRKGVPRRSEAGKSASYPSGGSCRSGSWMPKEPRIASTSGWYSKIILRKPCKNGIAAAAPSTEAETPTGVRRPARGPDQVRPLAGYSPRLRSRPGAPPNPRLRAGSHPRASGLLRPGEGSAGAAVAPSAGSEDRGAIGRARWGCLGWAAPGDWRVWTRSQARSQP